PSSSWGRLYQDERPVAKAAHGGGTLMIKRMGLWVACLALGLMAAGARAAEPAQMTFPKQVVLSKAQVEKVLATFPQVEALNKKYGEPEGDYSDGDIGASIQKALKDAGALNEFNGIVRAQGFSGFDDWWPIAFSAIAAANPADFTHDATDFNEALANVQSNTK